MRRIVSCNGCFGILHPGHFFYLGFARGQGSDLVVGINSDRYIVSKKGYTPTPEIERRRILMSLGFIRDVVIFDEPDPREFIRKLSPDVHCTGEEYRDTCVEKPLCLEMGIKLVFIPRIGSWSTTAILKGEIAHEGNIKVLSA